MYLYGFLVHGYLKFFFLIFLFLLHFLIRLRCLPKCTTNGWNSWSWTCTSQLQCKHTAVWSKTGSRCYRHHSILYASGKPMCKRLLYYTGFSTNPIHYCSSEQWGALFVLPLVHMAQICARCGATDRFLIQLLLRSCRLRNRLTANSTWSRLVLSGVNYFLSDYRAYRWLKCPEKFPLFWLNAIKIKIKKFSNSIHTCLMIACISCVIGVESWG